MRLANPTLKCHGIHKLFLNSSVIGACSEFSYSIVCFRIVCISSCRIFLNKLVFFSYMNFNIPLTQRNYFLLGVNIFYIIKNIYIYSMRKSISFE